MFKDTPRRLPITVKCKHCGRSFKASKYYAPRAKYCSQSCKGKAERKRVRIVCKICGTAFIGTVTYANRAKYCSRSCYYKAMHLTGSRTYTCKNCEKQFVGRKSTPRKYCSLACAHKAGAENFTPKASRKFMKKRGLLEKCERCGYSEKPQIIGVHHKDHNHKNNKPSNLEALCPNCHSLEHLKHIVH